MITDVLGRKNIVLEGKSGEKYNGPLFMNLMSRLQQQGYRIKQFRIIKDSPEHITWCLAMDAEFAAQKQEIEAFLRESAVKNDFAMDFKWSAFIEPDANGKLRILIDKTGEEG